MELENWKISIYLYILSGQAEAVLSVGISPDGKEIISGSVDRKISSWQLDKKDFTAHSII
mgnify:CR=1 FL=1